MAIKSINFSIGKAKVSFHNAPEEFNGIVDKKSDIWRLGTIFYELFIGKQLASNFEEINNITNKF
jgi:serine/threonine protein kinase